VDVKPGLLTTTPEVASDFLKRARRPGLSEATGPDRRVPVSTDGGTHPRWNPNGRELFYRNENKMMVVDVPTTSNRALSKPRVLFEQRYAFGSAQTVANYDVSLDGERFIMIKDDSASGRINVVLNWTEELKRLVPTQ
jgi:hypothetical protein